MAPARPSATLVIDGLLGAAAPGGTDLPALSAPGLDLLLARADPCPPPAASPEAALFALFGLAPQPGADGGDLAVATLTLAADTGQRPAGWWMRADPVHLRTATDELVLVEPEALALSGTEAEHLCAAIREHFAPEGWRLLAPVPERWYLQPREAPRLVTTPLPAVIARPISAALPRGADGGAWRRILNEIQMLLFEHPVNTAREARGLPAVNSVWPWGGGSWPGEPAAGWSRAWGEDALLRGLALAAGVTCTSLPADAHAWLQEAGGGHAQLLVIDGLRNAASYRDGHAWWAGVLGLDTAWIEPLVAAVAQGRVASLEVVDPRAGAWRLDRRAARRWWRRPRPFVQAHAGGRKT